MFQTFAARLSTEQKRELGERWVRRALLKHLIPYVQHLPQTDVGVKNILNRVGGGASLKLLTDDLSIHPKDILHQPVSQLRSAAETLEKPTFTLGVVHRFVIQAILSTVTAVEYGYDHDLAEWIYHLRTMSVRAAETYRHSMEIAEALPKRSNIVPLRSGFPQDF